MKTGTKWFEQVGIASAVNTLLTYAGVLTNYYSSVVYHRYVMINGRGPYFECDKITEYNGWARKNNSSTARLKILEQNIQLRRRYLWVIRDSVKKPMRTTDDEKIVIPANCVSCIWSCIFRFYRLLSVLRGAVRQANRLLADDRALLCPYPMLDKGSEQNAHDQKDVC